MADPAGDAAGQQATVELSPLARLLFEHSLLRGRFELRSGAISDRYFDKYRATTHPLLLRELTDALGWMAREAAPGCTCMVAPELGAVPLAAALSLDLEIPYVIVRGSGKDYGTAKRLEGVPTPGAQCFLLEDVVTSGGAAIDALQAARDAGLVVSTALCVLDRDGGGREALATEGVELHSLLGRAQFDAAFDAGIGLEA